MAERKDFHPILIPALDALIGNPELITPTTHSKLKANDLLIPTQYIDRIHEFHKEKSSRGESANKLLEDSHYILEAIHYSNDSDTYTCANGMRIHFICNEELELIDTNGRPSSTAHALATAQYAQKEYGKDEIAILTGDNYMASKALLSDIDVAHVNPYTYTGRRKLILPEKYYTDWFTHRCLSAESFAEAFPDQKPLLINEFVEFEVDANLASSTYGYSIGSITQLIGRFEYDERSEMSTLRRLHYVDNLPNYIQPRSAGQAMLAEALMAPADEIPIVICPAIFGTGKTYLATSIGLTKVTGKEPDQDRIFVVPRDAELGKPIGFLPGDEREKTIAKAMPIIDNVRAYVKNKEGHKKGNAKVADNINERVVSLLEKYFEFASIINMGGRSLSNSWIIYDEAQDMERFQINQLMKRIGDGSKMIITGDPNQVNNKHMNYYSNGLMYAATKMAGSPYAAVVSMFESEITRSKAAREIARRLDH